MMDDLRKSILALLPAVTPSARRRFAALLRGIADEQEQIADAQERSGHKFRAATAAPGRTGRPPGSGGQFIRWKDGEPGRSGTLHIAAALWYDLGSPARLDVQRHGTRLVLRPCVAPDGWAVTRPTGEKGGNPRMNIGVGPAETLRLTEGRIAAVVSGGAIVAQE